MSMSVFTSKNPIENIETIFCEKGAYEYPLTKIILDRYSKANVIDVDSHNNIPDVYDDPDNVKYWNKIKAHTLVLGIKKSVSARPNCRSTDWIAPSFSNGCALACSYCYVVRRKGYANPITLFVNVERIKKYLRGHSKRRGPKVLTPENAQTDTIYWTYDIGENCDVSVDALLSDTPREIVQFFRDEMPHGKASFATKYVNRSMLDYDPGRKTRIRFSMMPQKPSKVVDVRTSSIKDRINAINDFHRAGYEVHLNFSPVIIYDGWERDYVELFEQINDCTNNAVKKQLKCEVIFLTHNEKLHELNMKWHPKAEREYLYRYKNVDGKNKFGLPVLQQRKLSQNGMWNLRYKNNHKKAGVQTFRDLLDSHMGYCNIRYIF